MIDETKKERFLSYCRISGQLPPLYIAGYLGLKVHSDPSGTISFVGTTDPSIIAEIERGVDKAKRFRFFNDEQEYQSAQQGAEAQTD